MSGKKKDAGGAVPDVDEEDGHHKNRAQARPPRAGKRNRQVKGARRD